MAISDNQRDDNAATLQKEPAG